MARRWARCWRTGCGFVRELYGKEEPPAACPLCGYAKSHLHPGVLKDLDAAPESG